MGRPYVGNKHDKRDAGFISIDLCPSPNSIHRNIIENQSDYKDMIILKQARIM